MSKRKKLKPKQESREQRLCRARQWVHAYSGSHLVQDYRTHFKVVVACALNDLEAIGALPPEKLEALRRAEKIRLRQKQKGRELKKEQASLDSLPDSDDTFYYIAGYTSGGAPYGVTWEEMGLEPYESPDDTDKPF